MIVKSIQKITVSISYKNTIVIFHTAIKTYNGHHNDFLKIKPTLKLTIGLQEHHFQNYVVENLFSLYTY